MSLLDVARADLLGILADFSVPASIESPTGETASVNVIPRDTGEVVDMETGAAFSGRHISCAAAIDSLPNGIPVGVHDRARKPWKVSMRGQTFRVVQTRPDDVLGVLVMILEVLK